MIKVKAGHGNSYTSIITKGELKESLDPSNFDFGYLKRGKVYKVFSTRINSLGIKVADSKSANLKDVLDDKDRLFEFLGMDERNIYFRSVKGGYVESFPRQKNLVDIQEVR